MMKQILLLILLMCGIFRTGAQELTDEMMYSMVKLVDGHIDLTPRQETDLLVVLRSSYSQVQEIQRSNDADVIKLHKMTLVQNDSNDRLRKVLTEDQFKAYTKLLNGDSQPDVLTYEEKVRSLAEDLNVNGAPGDKFVSYLLDVEERTNGIMTMGIGEEEVAMELLTEILASDLDLIRLLGKDKYAVFFDLRAKGALSDVATNGNGNMEQVLLFFDISDQLKMTSAQNRDMIRLTLDNQMRIQRVKIEYVQNPALMTEKIRIEEQNGLLRLQEILTDDQVNTFLQMIGG